MGKINGRTEYGKTFEWFKRCDLTVAPLKKDDIYKVYIPVKIFDSMGAEIDSPGV